MFLVELGVPTLIPVAWILELIIPSWVRTLRVLKIGIAASFTGLMIITLLTGNYTFFNWLTILLALSMLDDGCWPAVMKRLLRWTETSPPRPMWRLAGEGVAVSLMLSLSLVVAIRDNAPSGGILSNTLYSKTHWLAPFRSINSYGLFRVMTTERNEIVIEVSDDGVYFQPLEFKWKPGRVDRPPPFVAPHQPRLDWQMWFAALHPGFIPQRDMQNASMIWFGKFLEQAPAAQRASIRPRGAATLPHRIHPRGARKVLPLRVHGSRNTQGDRRMVESHAPGRLFTHVHETVTQPSVSSSCPTGVLTLDVFHQDLMHHIRDVRREVRLGQDVAEPLGDETFA